MVPLGRPISVVMYAVVAQDEVDCSSLPGGTLAYPAVEKSTWHHVKLGRERRIVSSLSSSALTWSRTIWPLTPISFLCLCGMIWLLLNHIYLHSLEWLFLVDFAKAWLVTSGRLENVWMITFGRLENAWLVTSGRLENAWLVTSDRLENVWLVTSGWLENAWVVTTGWLENAWMVTSGWLEIAWLVTSSRLENAWLVTSGRLENA